MRAGVPSASFINLASIGLICKKQMHLLDIAIVPVTGVALQLEIGVTIREQCAALNDSLKSRLEPRWSSACRRRVHIFHSEGCLPFSLQGTCPPDIGHLVIVGVKEITEDAATQDQGAGQPERHPVELPYLRESRMISTSHTKSRFTLWTAAALLAVIVALVLPQSALAAPDRPTGLTATALGVCPSIRSWRRNTLHNNLLTALWTL